jgi:hypothetical protein
MSSARQYVVYLEDNSGGITKLGIYRGMEELLDMICSINWLKVIVDEEVSPIHITLLVNTPTLSLLKKQLHLDLR